MTAQQREALAILREHPRMRSEELGLLLGTSAQGAAATASSLVRRGYVRRIRERGLVYYEGIQFASR